MLLIDGVEDRRNHVQFYFDLAIRFEGLPQAEARGLINVPDTHGLQAALRRRRGRAACIQDHSRARAHGREQQRIFDDRADVIEQHASTHIGGIDLCDQIVGHVWSVITPAQ